MAEVPRTKRSEYQGAYKDLQQQIDELRRKIEEIQERDPRYATIFRWGGQTDYDAWPKSLPAVDPDADD